MYSVRQIEHISTDTVKKHGLNPEESLKLFNKFYSGNAKSN